MSAYLGVDIGTSSIKLLLLRSGVLMEERSTYENPTGESMMDAFLRALSALRQRAVFHRLDAIGFSGQTGTYFAVRENGEIVCSLTWREPGREKELNSLLRAFQPEEMRKMTGMAHPSLASYPIPSIRYLNGLHKHELRDCLFLQPKDYFIWKLCGRALSDPGSWRGFVHAKSGRYDPALLAFAGVREGQLPAMAARTKLDAAGERLTGLPEGTKVAVGLNDFYAALTGLGLDGPGSCFDVTGTSEHFGVTQSALARGKLISSPYRETYVHYGVTASSGASIDWARALFGAGDPQIPSTAPVFLPYLRGERAPVFDEKARGLFVGLTDRNGAEELKYSVYEGVVFSVYSIYEALGSPKIEHILGTGGATKNALLNRLKASMFNVPYRAERSVQGSALGAVKLGGGEWPLKWNEVEPEQKLREKLLERYEVYKRLYGAWQDIVEGLDPSHLFGRGE